MRNFLDERINSDGDEPSVQATNCYFEIEWPIDDSSCAVVYVLPRTESSAFIATCWDSTFDMLLTDMDTHTLETIVETWPTLATLLNNGLNDKYRHGALFRLEDVDDGETKWFVASVAGNIRFDSAEGLFTDRTIETINLVVGKSIELLDELHENQPSIVRAIGKYVKAGVGALAVSALAAAFGLNA